MSENRDLLPQSFMAYPRAGWHKWLFKAPLKLWRLGLGPLLGQYLLVLTHKGRKSGRSYHTMVEYHRLNERLYIPAAFGPQSDWYQNIQENPRVVVQTAKGSESVTATRVSDDEELLDVLALFMKRDAPLTKLYLQSLGIEPTPDDVLKNKEKIYWVQLEPVRDQDLLPLEVDLAWIWLAAMGVLLTLIARVGRKQRKV